MSEASVASVGGDMRRGSLVGSVISEDDCGDEDVEGEMIKYEVLYSQPFVASSLAPHVGSLVAYTFFASRTSLLCGSLRSL